MANDEKLSGLTRSLLIGVSLGSIALTQVGCAPEMSTTTTAATAPSGGADTISVRSGNEQKLCTQALRSQSVSDVNQLLVGYPDSRCIAPLLNALPARVLVGISPAAVKGISARVFNALPARVVSGLPAVARPAAKPGAARPNSMAYRY